jgi:hypothetical protein
LPHTAVFRAFKEKSGHASQDVEDEANPNLEQKENIDQEGLAARQIGAS